MSSFQSEIRDSDINELLDRVAKRKYQKYLYKVTLQKVRGFDDQVVTFDFPVTALIGPNGGGKTTILGAAACAYTSIKPRKFFAKSGSLDDSMQNWRMHYEVIDRTVNQRDSFRRTASFLNLKWSRDKLVRDVASFGVTRTVPANERAELQRCASRTFKVDPKTIKAISPDVTSHIEKILGKSIKGFSHIRVDSKGRVTLLSGKTKNDVQYSEFHFGAGESSIIRMIMKIESLLDNSLIVIEEIENGLHPVATIRMVEYLIDVAKRKKIQSIFTTHSNDALKPLPSQAIWATIDNKVIQGKLDIHSLRVITGQVDAELAIFTEDEFAAQWVTQCIRAHGNVPLDQIEIYPMIGDSTALNVNRYHNEDPSRRFPSLCFLDGDSQQRENSANKVYKLLGGQPERYIFDKVLSVLETQMGVLAVSLHLKYEDSKEVKQIVESVAKTNRDAHVLFAQIGKQLRLTPESIVKSAFLTVWSQAFPGEVTTIMQPVLQHLAKKEEASVADKLGKQGVLFRK